MNLTEWLLGEDPRLKAMVTGHSGYAPPGEDIVCSAVSALVQTFIASVERLTLDKINYTLKSGYTDIEYEEIPSEKTILLERAFFIGINGIAESYPDNVQIIREDVPKP